MNLAIDVILYIIITFGIVAIGVFVSFLADQMQNKTKMSAALISGVFLGILSGVPEIVADLTTVFIGSPKLAVGDIIGSNLINVSLLTIASLIFIKNIRKFESSRADFVNLGSLILMHALYVVGFFTDGIYLINQVFSIISFIAFIVYIVNVWLMYKDEHTSSHGGKNLIFK
jgi:cation:H+ antiporter